MSAPSVVGALCRALRWPFSALVPALGSRGWSGMVPRQIVIASEGGHATLAATSRREDAILDQLRQRFGHVSAERVLSGPGLENLYRAIAAVDEIDVPLRNASEITQAALQGACLTSRAALDMFCAMLGGFAGNVALTYGARGGVYIAGGIAPRILDYLIDSEFRRRFEQKGRFCTIWKHSLAGDHSSCGHFPGIDVAGGTKTVRTLRDMVRSVLNSSKSLRYRQSR